MRKSRVPVYTSIEDLASDLSRTALTGDGKEVNISPKTTGIHRIAGGVRVPEIGMRFDKGKVKLDLLPPDLEEQLARLMEKGLRVDLIPIEMIKAMAAILTHGAKKYDLRNWEKGLMYRATYASTRRHLAAWRRGEKKDPESELPTLYGALFGVAALITFEERGMGDKLDDFREKRNGE